MVLEEDPSRVARWYFGGVAATAAATVTHPLDLLKVLLQTPDVVVEEIERKKKPNLVKTTIDIVRRQGFLALYNGLSAGLLRQATYSTTRFGIYETTKQIISGDSTAIPFHQKVFLAGISGAVGGWVGSPADMIMVRMQNDVKLPADKRRNYKHAFDGLIQVCRKEGFRSLFNGATTATARSIWMTIGQLSFYDQFKYLLLTHFDKMFQDNLVTHFTASFLAGAGATTITQPIDVVKTVMMNAPKGQFRSIGQCTSDIFRTNGVFGFFKGYVPRFIRLAPHTVLTFVFYEQLRMRFGYNKTI